MDTNQTKDVFQVAEKFLYYSSLGARAIGVDPGRFLRLKQGHRRADGVVLHLADVAYKSGDECFEDFTHEPEVHWGTGVYLVKKDGTLLALRNDWDSSD